MIMVAVMGGQGCGGIFACIVNLVTKAAFDDPIGRFMFQHYLLFGEPILFYSYKSFLNLVDA